MQNVFHMLTCFSNLFVTFCTLPGRCFPPRTERLRDEFGSGMINTRAGFNTAPRVSMDEVKGAEVNERGEKGDKLRSIDICRARCGAVL